MAPKRQRKEKGESSSSTRAYDKKKFVSPEAADKFDNVLVGRALVPERGLRPDETDGDLASMIRRRGWETFTAQPGPAIPALVKEFYANAQDTPACEVSVRGQTVIFSRAAINAYYNLRGYPDCPFASFKPNYEEIVQQLCLPGTEWKRSVHDGQVKSFPANRLSKYGKVWYAFLCAKLLPCTHVSNVRRERVGLLYAIITGLDIDVGRVIEASIKRALKGGTTGGLPHPSLITALCKHAGVKWRSVEVLQPPTTLLDHHLIVRYTVLPGGGESHPRGLGFITEQQPPADPTPTAAPSHSAGSSDSDLYKRMQRLEHRMDRMEDNSHRLAMRQGEMHMYNASFNAALISYFQRLNPNVELGSFPPAPGLSEYPPPDDDSDDAEYSEEEEDNAAAVDPSD